MTFELTIQIFMELRNKGDTQSVYSQSKGDKANVK